MSELTTRIITIVGFALVIGAMFGLEYAGRRPGAKIPTVGQWLAYLMKPRIGRFIVLAGWWWLGWHYFAR